MPAPDMTGAERAIALRALLHSREAEAARADGPRPPAVPWSGFRVLDRAAEYTARTTVDYVLAGDDADAARYATASLYLRVRAGRVLDRRARDLRG